MIGMVYFRIVIKTQWYYYFANEENVGGSNILQQTSYARINSVVWSAALDGVIIAVNSPISLKY